ncbi:MAG: alpha/beta fold hydrolase [Myxococcota bacterium]
MRHVHVVGSSPRTGTTLLAELMGTGFAVEAFGRHERSVFKPAPGRCDVYLSKNPQDVRVAARLLAVDPDLFVLHMVRDPRDVVVSRHRRDPDAYWTTLGLWHDFRRGARRAEGHPRFLTLRYEDLVRDPDAVQDEIASRLPFLKRLRPFSSFADAARPPVRSVEALGGVRDVDASQVGAWRRHRPRLAAQLALHGGVDRDLRELGYERDDEWKRDLEGVAPDNGRSHLAESVPWWVWLREAWLRERAIRAYRTRLSHGGAPSPARRRRRPRARTGPFETTLLRAGAVRLEVGVLGEGPPVLLLPGLGLPGTEEFRVLGPALAAAGYRAWALNPRGVGRSRGPLRRLTLHDLADDAAALARHAGAPVHVVGRGFGNRVARCLAADHPEQVRRVCLIAAGGLVPPLPTPKRTAPRSGGRPKRRWPEVRRAQKRASDATPLADWWDGGSAPLLVIQGLDDTTAPPENGRRLAHDHPERVRLVEVADAGHEVLHQQSDRVAREILAFLAETPERGAPEGD